MTTTFVNGTGDLFLRAYENATKEMGVSPAQRHYTSMGEMKLSLRSAASALLGARAAAGVLHGIGSDYAAADAEDGERVYVLSYHIFVGDL